MNTLPSRFRLIIAQILFFVLVGGMWTSAVYGQIHTITFTNYTQEERDAVWRAVRYLNEVILSDGVVPGNRDFFDGTIEFSKQSGTGGGHNNGNISMGSSLNWGDARNNQIKRSTANPESIAIHELVHALGITTGTIYFSGNRVAFGTVRAGSWNDFLYAGNTKVKSSNGWDRFWKNGYYSTSNLTFRGANAANVWSDGLSSVRYVPVCGGSSGGSSVVHPVTPFGIMNPFYGDSPNNPGNGGIGVRPFLSEVELAIMQDLGHAIDIKNYFGRSFYRTHSGTITVNEPISTLNGMYGIGLHVVAGGNNITLNTDITTRGYAGAGIRIENAGRDSTFASVAGNTVTIAPGRTVTATGAEGVGVLITHDASGTSSSTINNHGTIRATGSNGIGVWLNGRGLLNNYDNGNVDSVLFGTNGTVNNRGNATIGIADVYGNGRLDNSETARIGTVNLYDNGRLLHSGTNAIIGRANVYDSGLANNWVGATIDSIFLYGGAVNNIGKISDLTYTSGTYDWRKVEQWTGSIQTGTGTIGTLNVAVNASDIDWGNVGTANIGIGGNVNNRYTIGTAKIDGGFLGNYGAITNATVNGRSYTGGWGGMVMVYSGEIFNDARGTITNATFNSGWLTNYGLITNATVDQVGNSQRGGSFDNYGRIASATMYNGVLDNRSRIDNLIYTGGTLLTNGSSTGSITLDGRTGGWDFGIGWLQIGNGGSTDTLERNIINNSRVTFNHSDILYHDNMISGTGSLTKTGTGTLMLSGNNSYTGNTTVNGGSLKVTGSLGNGTYAGRITNDALLVFDQANSQTLSGVISGDGNLTKQGTGTLTLTGTNTYAGDTLVNAGTLDNQGSINRTTVSGGTFNNSGTINGTAMVKTGSFANSGSILGTTTVNAGTFDNLDGGILAMLDMFGGTVSNAGWIGDMIYGGGTFNGAEGSIEALTIAGFSSENSFGTVESLAFTSDGSGFMTITGYLGDDDGLSFMPNFQVSTVDLAGANLMLDFTRTLTEDYAGLDFDTWTADFATTFENGLGTFGVWGVSWGSLFGIADDLVSNGALLHTLSVGWGDDQWAYIWRDGAMTHEMWNVNDWGVSAVPEPATLVLVGLGLAGLGLARRRRYGNSGIGTSRLGVYGT